MFFGILLQTIRYCAYTLYVMLVKKVRLNFRYLLAAFLFVLAVIGFLTLRDFQSNTSVAVCALCQKGVKLSDGALVNSFDDFHSRKTVPHPCYDGLCEDVLFPGERENFKSCIYDTQHPKLNKLTEGPLVELTPTPCRFINSFEKARNETVLLVSFSGSGNTWTRGLLQQATGYCTGSHICDIDLRRHGFPGEGVIGKQKDS